MIQAFSFLFLSSSSNIYTRRLDTFGDKPVDSREIEKERESLMIGVTNGSLKFWFQSRKPRARVYVRQYIYTGSGV